MDNKKLGLISEGVCKSSFKNMHGYFVKDDHENNPNSVGSPNLPRKKRLPGYQNPILGDPGVGSIERWSKVRVNAIQTLVDQMIEQFTRDREWYKGVRCREALWNMYRRLQWWVNQQVGEEDSDYAAALQMIKDVIYRILDTGEEPYLIKYTDFSDGFDDSYVYDGNWYMEYGSLAGSSNGQPSILSSTVHYANNGLVTFNIASMLNDGTVKLILNGELVWEYSNMKTEGTWYVRNKSGSLTPFSEVRHGIHDTGVVGDLEDRYYYIKIADNKWKVVYIKDFHNDSFIGYHVNDIIKANGGKFTEPLVDALGEHYPLEIYTDSELLDLVDSVYIENSSLKSVVSDLYFRDITVNVVNGINTFQWIVEGTKGTNIVRLKNIKYTGLRDGVDRGDIPVCKLPYNHHYSADYTNFFDGTNVEIPLFSTRGQSTTTDFLDMIRFVSSKENIEWDLVSSVDGSGGNENIFKLPLDRLPETLSSKLTFNWRLKRKGFISFKYWVDGGNQSQLSFYINNNQVGGPWYDTDGWKEVKFYVSQGQTYKFDFVVTKLASMRSGLDAVYIKDIEVMEVIKYDDEPMPKDYDKHGEDVEGKWKIYSKDSALATFYRGFTDGFDDNERELKVELYSECDGEISFGYELGVNEPDRKCIGGIIFNEDFQLDESVRVWSADIDKDVKVEIKPYYDDGWRITDKSYITLNGDSTIEYLINAVEMDRLFVHGELEIICPPLIPIDYNASLSTLDVHGDVSGYWSFDGNFTLSVSSNHYPVTDYGEASFIIEQENPAYMYFDVVNGLNEWEYVDVYLNGLFEKRFYGGDGDLRLVPVYLYEGLNEIIFKAGGQPTRNESPVQFYGDLDFDVGNDKYLAREPLGITKIFEHAAERLDVNETYSQLLDGGEERSLDFYLHVGKMTSKSSWIASGNFLGEFTVKLMPNDDFKLYLPFNTIPYIKDEYKEIIDDILEVDVILSEHFNEPIDKNDLNELDNFTFNSSPTFYDTHGDNLAWEWVDIFQFFGTGGSGDGVVIVDGIHESNVTGTNLIRHTMTVDIPNPLNEDSEYIDKLSFEYGARFQYNDHLNVYALTGSGVSTLLYTTNENEFSMSGKKVQNLELPNGTEKVIFEYFQLGGM